jgi:hypothetical protein
VEAMLASHRLPVYIGEASMVTHYKEKDYRRHLVGDGAHFAYAAAITGSTQ